jgi:transposase
LNRKEKEYAREVIIKYSPAKRIPKGKQRMYNGGYLFFQKIYHDLAIQKICRKISERYKFTFNLDSIRSRLLYTRIIYPSSKAAALRLSDRFLEAKDFELQHIYRALGVIAAESDFIQAELYKNSLKLSDRNTGVLYYDCTNFFFEIEQSDGIKQYGHSKEHKPNPIVGMGFFMDGDGMPLAFSIHEGNKNEQTTLRPLEKKILSDFKLSRFVVCTDAGLASTDNRKFNDKAGRAFITTQSVKKLKKYQEDFALSPTGWLCPERPVAVNGKKAVPKKLVSHDISGLDDDDDYGYTFYKERWINEDGLEQRLIVTYSLKYRNYQRKIRAGQIERAQKLISANTTKIKKANANDFKRFISKTNVTPDGEVAAKEIYGIDTDLIAGEEKYDGFYAVCTNLEDDAREIIKVNHRRWEIEECFRIMKSEFKARPAYLSRDDRIKAHFATCFIALMLYRLLEKKIGNGHTCHDIIDGLRDFNFYKIDHEGYIPAYVRSDLTDDLHDAFGFRTDNEIVNLRQMKKVFKETKK